MGPLLYTTRIVNVVGRLPGLHDLRVLFLLRVAVEFAS
jgi:hypothetical protein